MSKRILFVAAASTHGMHPHPTPTGYDTEYGLATMSVTAAGKLEDGTSISATAPVIGQ